MKKPTILLVDDEQKLLDLVSFRLKLLGYHVVTAQAGEDALVLAQTEPPDLFVLDIGMPGMDGISVCSRLKAMPAFASTPILMLTARSGVEDVNRSIAAGAIDYIVKPFDPAVLETKIGRHLSDGKVRDSSKKGRS